MNITQNSTLKDLQQYVEQIIEQRGWKKNNALEIFLLLTEEIGELAKAIRYDHKLYVEKNKKSNIKEIASEMADILSYLLELANYYRIDLTEAFIEKEQENQSRQWQNRP